MGKFDSDDASGPMLPGLRELWEWNENKLPCKIRNESGNPAADELRERLAELVGMDLKKIIEKKEKSKKRNRLDDAPVVRSVSVTNAIRRLETNLTLFKEEKAV